MKERIVIAERVLRSIQNLETPSQEDLAALQSWVDQEHRYADPDELACIVINTELQRRKNSRVGFNGQSRCSLALRTSASGA